MGGAFIVSGPIYKEIGMNVSYGSLALETRPTRTWARVGSLMCRNLGGYKETVTHGDDLWQPDHQRWFHDCRVR